MTERKMFNGYVGWVWRGDAGDPVNVQGADLWYLAVKLLEDKTNEEFSASIASKDTDRWKEHQRRLVALESNTDPSIFGVEKKPNGKWKLVAYPGFDSSVGFTDDGPAAETWGEQIDAPTDAGGGTTRSDTPSPAPTSPEGEPSSQRQSGGPPASLPSGDTFVNGARVGNVVSNVTTLVANGVVAYNLEEMSQAAERLWNLGDYIVGFARHRGGEPDLTQTAD
jgi:hypothetical protein